MKQTELARFSVTHRSLPWPWVAIAAGEERFCALTAPGLLASWAVSGDAVREASTFPLPPTLVLDGSGDAELRAFALSRSGDLAAALGPRSVVTLAPDGVVHATNLAALAGADFEARALVFDRAGTRLWISGESPSASLLLLLDARTHAAVEPLRSRPFPSPGVHELYVHPVDDAVLLLVACGQDGTFARVAGFSDGPIEHVATALDEGSVSAGFVGFSRDGARVHLAEADELRTHAWPALHELSSVELADDFVSNYAGAVIGPWVLVDGQDTETGADAVMQFDRAALRGARIVTSAPPGMWAGRLVGDCIVTVDGKGEPAAARVIRLSTPLS